jgi:hypothetical protein
MQQTFEYYSVDPETWKDVKMLDKILSSTIDRDEESETLETAQIECDIELSEQYVRIYLITIQDGKTEKIPLGTFLVQTPSESFDGKVKTSKVDAYSPLLEWKDTMPPLGYSVFNGADILKTAWLVGSEHNRAPVVPASANSQISFDFVAEPDDTWLTFLKVLVGNSDYHLALDELSRIIFEPNQDIASLQPVWTYTDDNSSILYSDLSVSRDLYGIPNVVEVIFSKGETKLVSRVVNDDPESPTSTVSRGREVIHRVSDPEVMGNPSQAQLDKYAEQLLRNLSSLEYKITYKHGYCPARVGDCVMLDYRRAGLTRVRAKVISQSITCEAGCPVDETAVYTMSMWKKEG